MFSLAENTAKVNAYSLWRQGKPYVFLNMYKSAESSRLDASHELAHLALHQDGGYTGREAEDQANRFAAAFLMPRSDVVAHLPYANSVDQMIRAKARWKVSLAALNYRLHKLNLTSEWKYRDFCIEISNRGYHRQEPFPIEREKSVVWAKVLKALWAERTTIGHIARDLALPEAEVSGLIFGVTAMQPCRPAAGQRLKAV